MHTRTNQQCGSKLISWGQKHCRAKQQAFRGHVGEYHGSPNNEGRFKTRVYPATGNPPITLPDKQENDNIARKKRQSHKHRHENLTDWAETLLSPH